MKSSFWAAAAFVGVFALGAIAGVGGTRAYMFKEFGRPFDGPPREVKSRLRIEAMRRQLSLSPEQVTQIRTILRDNDDEFEQAMAPCRKELDTLHKRIDDRIVETLDPSQVAKYREFAEKMHSRRGHGPFPHPSFRPPPPR